MLLIIHNSILIGLGELGTWYFPYTGDHNAYCLVKTQLHNSKTFLRREELKLESYFDVIQSSVSATKVRTFSSYICMDPSCACEVETRVRIISPQRDLPLSPAQKRQAKNPAKRTRQSPLVERQERLQMPLCPHETVLSQPEKKKETWGLKQQGSMRREEWRGK